MPSVSDILARKGHAVITLGPDDTVLDAARVMNERAIGGVVVREGERLAGIFTERDVLRRVVAEQRDPATTRLREVMTREMIIFTPDTSLEECAAVMTARRVRHVPIVGERGLAGLVTIGDVLAFQVTEQQTTIQQLHNYVFDMR